MDKPVLCPDPHADEHSANPSCTADRPPTLYYDESLIRKRHSNLPFGFISQTHTCDKCGFRGPTSVKYSSGKAVVLAVLCCVVFGCVAGCCLIPCCVNALKDVHHFCANCHERVGYRARV